MFDNDDFFIDDNELAEDNQMSLVDDAICKSIDAMEKVIKDLRSNLIFNEQKDARNNLRLLSMHLDAAIQLAGIDESELSEEEVYDKIEAVIKQTTELTFTNMNDLLPKEEDSSIDSNDPVDTDFDF